MQHSCNSHTRTGLLLVEVHFSRVCSENLRGCTAHPFNIHLCGTQCWLGQRRLSQQSYASLSACDITATVWGGLCGRKLRTPSTLLTFMQPSSWPYCQRPTTTVHGLQFISAASKHSFGD